MHSEQLLQMNKDVDPHLEITLIANHTCVAIEDEFSSASNVRRHVPKQNFAVFFHHFVPLTLNPSLRVRCVRRSWT